MEQTKTQRIKLVIRYLVSTGKAENQEDLGKKLGINSKSYLSQLINGKSNSDILLNKLKEFEPSINVEWIENGGDLPMFLGNFHNFGHNSTNVAGISNTVNDGDTLNKAMDEIAEQRQLVKKSQEQIDRLISIIEKMQCSTK